MHLPDLKSYLEADQRLTKLYAYGNAWTHKVILNIAGSGSFRCIVLLWRRRKCRGIFLQHDGSVWTTDKDGVIMSLLAAEISARTAKDPGGQFRVLAAEFGDSYYTCIDSVAAPEQKALLREPSPEVTHESSRAGEYIIAKLTRAPGNNAPIVGLKTVAASRLVCRPAFRHRGFA
jgi:hypothetical protein